MKNQDPSGMTAAMLDVWNKHHLPENKEKKRIEKLREKRKEQKTKDCGI